MKRVLISLNLFALAYDGLAKFAQKIHDGFVANVADYGTPNPLMAAFQLDIDALNAAILKWGKKGNRGSHLDHLALIAAATVVRNDLRMLADYAQNIQPNDEISWAAVGFTTRSPKSKPVKLQMVQNFRHFISRDIAAPGIKLKWKKPLNTKPGDVKGYIAVRNNVAVFPGSPDGHALVNVIGVVPNTNFVDKDPFVGENYYWVLPFNSIGNGVVSEAVMVVSAKSKP